MRHIEEVNDFGHVRSLVQRGPGAWGELSLYLERWLDKTSFTTVVAPYVRDHIRAWPRGACTIPRRWKRWILLGHEVLPIACFDAMSLAHIPVGASGNLNRDLWNNPNLQHLSYLDLSDTHILMKSLGYLMGGADRFKRLRALTLDHNPQLISKQGKLAPFNQPRFAQLDVLALKSCEITHRSMDALTRNDVLGNLKMLKLSRNPLTDKGVRALSSSVTLRSLTSLDLNDVIMTQRGVIDLMRANFLEQLVWLSFSIQANYAPGKTALMRFLSESKLARLGSLTLSAPWLDDDIAAHIARQPHLAGLNTLVLHRTFDETMLAHFAEHSRVDALDLPRLTHRGVDALVQSPYLSDQVKTHWNLLLEHT